MDYYNFTKLLKRKGYEHIKTYATYEVWEKDNVQYTFPMSDYVSKAIVGGLR